MTTNNTKKFQNELMKLLEKYPDIGEFTIHISPRLKIVTDAKTLENPLKNLIKKVEPETEKRVKIPHPSDPLDVAMALEGGVTKSRLEEMAKSASIQ